jgi:predicted transcriptional regulator of viral defense system
MSVNSNKPGMDSMARKIDTIIAAARERGRLRSRDLAEIGASRTMLVYLTKKGILRRIARGVYILADQISEHEAFLEIAVAVPHGVICLLSALQFHEITTQMPMETWIAIQRNSTVPRSVRSPVRIVKFSGPTFTEGIEEHHIDGLLLRVYCPAKTVVDCFKFRNRIGLDVAREALVDCLGQKKATRDEMYQYAKLCRMTRVMRPYLEMV